MTGPLLAAGREAAGYALDDRCEAEMTGEADAVRDLAGPRCPVPVVPEAAGRETERERPDPHPVKVLACAR